jgi:hypothetical protein
MAYICIHCGEDVEFKNMRGSMKAPCCPKCFSKHYNNSLNKYEKKIGAKVK